MFSNAVLAVRHIVRKQLSHQSSNVKIKLQPSNADKLCASSRAINPLPQVPGHYNNRRRVIFSAYYESQCLVDFEFSTSNFSQYRKEAELSYWLADGVTLAIASFFPL